MSIKLSVKSVGYSTREFLINQPTFTRTWNNQNCFKAMQNYYLKGQHYEKNNSS
jgi:hypothetical protein